MYTYCPNCHAVFQVTSEQIELAEGQVRCSECEQVYQAADFLFEELSMVQNAIELSLEPDDRPVDVAEDDTLTAIPEAEDESKGAGWEMTTEAGPAGQLSTHGWQQQSVSISDIGSGVAIGLLGLLLGLQWMFFNRDALASEAAWRPAMERFCAVLLCDLPMRVDLGQFGIVERDVRKHPVAENALLINITFENRADFVQPYPLFEVSFTDKSGDPVAMRRFTPREYLGDSAGLEAGVSPGSPVQAVLEVLDPGPKAVSFQFGFL